MEKIEKLTSEILAEEDARKKDFLRLKLAIVIDQMNMKKLVDDMNKIYTRTYIK